MTRVLYAVEGPTDQPIAEALISHVGRVPRPMSVEGGSWRIDRGLRRWTMPSNVAPTLVIRDWDGRSDQSPCTAELVQRLTRTDRPAHVAVRIAVRATESWLMAGRAAAVEFFRTSKIPSDTDDIENPKLALVNACRSSRTQAIRRPLGPPGRPDRIHLHRSYLAVRIR